MELDKNRYSGVVTIPTRKRIDNINVTKNNYTL